MTIDIKRVVPIPLRDRLEKRPSDIWHTELTIQMQDMVKVQAPSGSGKTTLIHCLYHLRKDYTGDIFWNGRNARDFTDAALADWRQTTVSIVFQDLRLFPQLTARENIELKRIMQTPFHPAESISEMAERLGISHILDQPAGLCSYGEQQRVAIIRALMQPFSWLLLDEPFSHLDSDNTRKAALLILEECRKRAAGLLITDLEPDQHFPYDHLLQL